MIRTCFQQEYVRSEISSDDYAWFETTIPTIAVKAVLICFDFSSKRSSYYRLRCQQLSQLGQVIRANLDDLKRTGHPKWQEVNLDEELDIWKPDSCSRMKPTPPPTPTPSKLRELIERGSQ